MSSEADAPSRELYYTSEFKRNLRQLAKKYRHIQSDIQPLLATLATGATPGDRIPGVSFELYKVRARNTDRVRGKSGGYRIIYQQQSETTIILITIYSKTEQSDIALQEIQSIILDYEQERQEDESPESAAEGTGNDHDKETSRE